MENGITTYQTNLPAEVREQVQLLRKSPERYYEVVKAERPEDDREQGAITIYNLNKEMTKEEAMLAISIAILEVKEWFNVKGNMTAKQIKLTAEMILDHPLFYDLSIGNIKACFRQKMMSEKLYDRLDGNIIIGWLKQFKSEMADAVYNQRLSKDKEEIENYEKNNILEKRALDLLKNLPKVKKLPSREEIEQKRKDWLKYKANYMLRKKGTK